VLDYSGFNSFQDPKKKEFMEKLVIPEAIKVLQSRLKVKDGGEIPPFNPTDSGCNDQGNFTIDNSPYTNPTQGDFILFLSVLNDNSDTLAYAASCLSSTCLLSLINQTLITNDH
jgi:hypothetical protein